MTVQLVAEQHSLEQAFAPHDSEHELPDGPVQLTELEHDASVQSMMQVPSVHVPAHPADRHASLELEPHASELAATHTAKRNFISGPWLPVAG